MNRDLKPDNVAPATMCLASDGTARPMTDVLRERAAHVRTVPAAIREEAFRVRAGEQALMQACTCGWPIRRAATETEHEPWCLAHRWIENQKERGELESATVYYVAATRGGKARG